MCKYNKLNDEFLLKVTHDSRLGLYDTKVIVTWWTDSLDFNPSHEILSDRTGIKRSNVSKSIKKLIDFGYLEEIGSYGRVKKYGIPEKLIEELKQPVIQKVDKRVQEPVKDEIEAPKTLVNDEVDDEVKNIVTPEIKDRNHFRRVFHPDYKPEQRTEDQIKEETMKNRDILKTNFFGDE